MKNLIGERAIPEMIYYRPRKLNEALQYLRDLKDCRIVAGATDFIPGVRSGKMLLPPGFPLVDISALGELSYIREKGGEIRIGALAPLADIEASDLIQKKAPLLAEAIGQIASPQIRNRGTIAGNLCNASPASDSATALLACNAAVQLQSLSGQRQVPLPQFFLGPGRSVLRQDEMVTEVRVPVQKGIGCFVKLGRREAFTLSIISVAAMIATQNGKFEDVRIALGAVAPTPMRASGAEGFLIGQNAEEGAIHKAAAMVADEVRPISDARASAAYRKDMARVLTERAIRSCLGLPSPAILPA